MYKQLMTTLFLLSGINSAMANECESTIDSTDRMLFDKRAMSIPSSCKTFTVTLTHSGKMGKDIMGHNWVLSEKNQAQAVATDGMTAGLDNDYLKPDDNRILAATKLIGGGMKTSVTLEVAKLSSDKEYTFFCSFPGHISMMKGTLSVG